ncbi:MAG: hypothetical protein SFY32_04855 [Bacteroidota bacterium]|nr:hypothetical protein [Bacteroidota bacterium]
MQKNTVILFALSGLLVLTSFNLSFAYKHDDLLARADQLYQQKKYSEAYQIYFNLFQKERQFTPQSLLKMAFIKDAWGDHAEALYFFNFFYENFPEKKVFNKMKEIADKNKFEGYEYSDLEFFSTLYKNYHFEINIIVMGMVLVYFMALATNLFFIRGISTSSPFFFIILLLISAYFINQAESIFIKHKAIVLQDKSILMSGPSAAANAVQTIKKGSRVVVLSNEEGWSKIVYQGQTYYIRKSNLNLL